MSEKPEILNSKNNAIADGLAKWYMFLALGIVSMSAAGPLVRIAQGAGPFVIASYRLFFASVIVIPIGRPWQAFKYKKEVLWASVSGVFLALHFWVWIASFDYISISASVVLVTTTPIFIALAEFIFWKKRPSWLTLLGIILAMSGASIIALVGGNIGGSLLGSILALLGAVFGSAYLLTGKIAQGKLTLWQTVSISYPVASVLLFVAALITKAPLVGFEPKTWWAIALMAIFPQILGHTSLNMGMVKISPVVTVTANLFEPVGASILAYLILGEAVPVIVFLAAPLVLLGVYLTIKNRN